MEVKNDFTPGPFAIGFDFSINSKVEIFEYKLILHMKIGRKMFMPNEAAL